MANDTPAWALQKPPSDAPAWASAPATTEAVPSWAAAPVSQAPAPAPSTMGNPDSNVRKFLNFLSKAEGASYNTVVGGGSFNDFSKHPRIVGLVTKDGPSTAAGAYQITSTTYDDVASKLGIKDFSERSQDQIAIELIRRNGALQDVAQGNWNAAINKLGGTWASLPSSPYNQPKKSMEWSLAVLNGQTPPPGYQQFAPVRTNVDQKSLRDDADWLRASQMMFELFERKPFQGTQDELADYGKTGMANFNFDLVSMAEIAHAVTNASPEQQQAFLYMLDTYDNTNMSWEGAGRATKAALTDPTNLVGIGTLGVATAGKFLGRKAAVEAVKESIIKSLARTGLVAGIDAGVAGAAQETTKQGIEIAAGRREEYDIAKIGIATGTSAVAGAVLGTAADAAASKIFKIIRGEVGGAGKAVPEPKPAETPSVSGVAKSAEKKADELLNPKPVQEVPSAQSDTFSGTLPGVHGSERPIEKVTGSAAIPEEMRYDSTGGVWGDGFYSAEKGDYSWFRGSEIRMTEYSHATEVTNDFKKAAVLTPETTIGVFEKLGIKGVEFEDDLVKAFKEKGYDGVIVRGFNGDIATKTVQELQAKGILGPELHGNGFEAALMNQVVHFAPEKGVKVGGADSTLGPLMESRREIAAEIDQRVKAAGYSYLNDAQYIVKRVEEYAGKDDPISKSNYDYARKQYGDRYDEAKKFLDSISDLLKKRNQVDDKISEIANSPKKVAANDNPVPASRSPETVLSVSEEVKPGFAQTAEPVSASLKTDSGFEFTVQRDWKGKYSFITPDGKKIGAISYMQTPLGEWKVSGVSVDPEFQRKGIANAVYDFIEGKVIGQPFDQVGGQSEAGRLFREARDARKAARESSPSAVRDPNLGSTLTPAEIAEATARKQKGRLEADNVVPNVAGKEDIPIDVPQMNTGLRSTPMSMEELTGLGEKVATQIRSLSNEDLPKALEQLRTGSLPFEETRIVARGVQIAADELRITKAELLKEINAGVPAERLAELSAKVEALDARLAPMELADDAFGSMAGSILRQRQEGLPGVQGVTVESIMKEQNLTKAEAQQVWSDMVSKAEKTAAAEKVASGYDSKITEAIGKGNLLDAAKLAVQKSRELSSMADQAVPGGASFIQKLTEFAISNVFSFKTVLVNLIPSGLKTLVIPGLKLIATDPLSKVARVEAMASYSAMRSSFGAALQAAKAGFKYEQALLTRDGTRLVEGELAMTGKLGGGLRIFPRILNASDEFLSRINYDSFIAGRAAAEAAMKATEAGKTGKALDEAVDKAVKAALRTSREVAKGDELVQPIINKGVNLGLTGDDLFKWVEKEAVKNPEALRKGTDEEALAFVRDVLYKRGFSGEGAASKAAIQYEETLKKFPSLKLVVGQLFFRTPIRVFEEGVRLTPGLQLLAPNFISDLAGKNGTLRQVRAQSEAMSSLAIAGAVLSLYGQGKITGDGAYSDWKQGRTREDGPLPPPYSIVFSDGSTWSYRSFDPLATPIKIMINGLERMDRLHMRESQGEFVNKDEFDKAMAYLTVGTTAVASAIRDANLVAGIDGTIKFFENLADPERKEDAFLKMVGEKLFLLVPNTLHKIAKDNDPTIKDPVTFWQVVEEKLLRPFGRDDIKTPYSYDVLGNVRKLADTGSLWNVFSTASVEERGRGMSEEGKFVMQELDRLARVTGATFKAPTKNSELGELDLRTMLASDGKSTLYDVWQKNYQAMEPDKILYPILKEEMPDGTFKYKAARVELVQQTIKDLQDNAFWKMMAQEEDIIERYRQRIIDESKAKAGLFDSKRPY